MLTASSRQSRRGRSLQNVHQRPVGVLTRTDCRPRPWRTAAVDAPQAYPPTESRFSQRAHGAGKEGLCNPAGCGVDTVAAESGKNKAGWIGGGRNGRTEGDGRVCRDPTPDSHAEGRAVDGVGHGRGNRLEVCGICLKDGPAC